LCKGHAHVLHARHKALLHESRPFGGILKGVGQGCPHQGQQLLRQLGKRARFDAQVKGRERNSLARRLYTALKRGPGVGAVYTQAQAALHTSVEVEPAQHTKVDGANASAKRAAHAQVGFVLKAPVQVDRDARRNGAALASSWAASCPALGGHWGNTAGSDKVGWDTAGQDCKVGSDRADLDKVDLGCKAD
nr:hypothetical protein [Tanacetum cinerariifolium]